MIPKLECCPHCGASAELCNTLRMTWWVQCTNGQCGAQTRHCGTANGAELAVQLWNRRYDVLNRAKQLQPVCPNCGGVLVSYVLTCIPPITEYRCHRCGFRSGSTQ